MAACASYLCAASYGTQKAPLIQHKSNDFNLQGWKRSLGWSSQPEGCCFRTEGRKQRRLNAFRLTVTSVSRNPQNVDMPPVLPKRKKKPFASPIKSSKKARVARLFQPRQYKAPTNGLLVQHLIPVGHDVMLALGVARRGVGLLLKQIPVHACCLCSEVFVGFEGHSLRTCQGPSATSRKSLHQWVKATTDDILVPVESYHLKDRLALPVSHEERFDVERILAIEELCIQAGVDVPEYPTLRHTEPIEPMTRKSKEDASWKNCHEFTFYTSSASYQLGEEEQFDDLRRRKVAESAGYVDEEPRSAEQIEEESIQTVENWLTPLVDVCSEDDLQTTANKTLQAWERLRNGARRLMSKYRVLACGYCPEIHVGPRGHRGRACGAFKHQWRNGMHGWQDATLDELIPPQYVWHVRDRFGIPLDNALRRFYGKAPALVELCVQAGLPVPENHRPLMRLDIAIPTLNEYENVI